MKLKLFILPALFLLSCNSTKMAYRLDKNQPIVDYNHSYDYYDTTMEVNRAIAKQDEQTLILYNGKKIDRKKLNRHLEKQKVKSIENIINRNKIVQLGYSYDNVKRILIVLN